MRFSDEQNKMLAEKLDASHVSVRKQSGVSLSYLEGYHVIDEANRIFGFDGWSYFVDDISVVAEQDVAIGAKKTPGKQVGVIAQVTVTAGGTTRQDVGFGSQRSTNSVEVYEMAYKEAVTDALKRSLRSYGNQFGNALYDKTQKNVEVRTNPSKRLREDSPRGGTPSKTVDDYKKEILAIETDEALENYRVDNRAAIKAHPDSEEIVNLFKERKVQVNVQ